MTEVNVKSSTIEKGLDLAKDFLQTIVKPSLSELGELFADRVKLWRLQNQLKNLDKVKKIIEDNNIKTKDINLKVLFPYLEAVSLEEDETLQDIWANLFVSYVDTSKNLTLIVYPEILRQLSTNEVLVLQEMGKRPSAQHFLMNLNSKIKITEEAISNLLRLGLIEENGEIKTNSNFAIKVIGAEKTNFSFKKNGRHKLTALGKAFLDACKPVDKRNE